jgi:trk system potassium uptake protein TrkH
MFVGASAGSTGGGMKCLRIMLCFKYCYKELFSMIHPRAVTHIKIGGKAVPDDGDAKCTRFLALYMSFCSPCARTAGWHRGRFYHRLGAVAATIGNIGPGFGMVGPVDNFAQIPYWGSGCCAGACCWGAWRFIPLSS